ncbi:YbeD family protein [Chitinibacter sp. S2-10]|uniref:YbeD family protein n=1 Tax=Chitinibacter sp. S2-10 TaxID=3373597 RepID=UPI003977A2C8
MGFTEIPSQKLEDLVTFPVLIPVKAVSQKNIDEAEFRAAVYAVTREHVTTFLEEHISIRVSSAGSYYSATLMITFEHVDQVYAVDAALRAHPLVLRVL